MAKSRLNLNLPRLRFADQLIRIAVAAKWFALNLIARHCLMENQPRAESAAWAYPQRDQMVWAWSRFARKQWP